MKNLLLAIFFVLYCSDASQACDWLRRCSGPIPVVHYVQPVPQAPVFVQYYYPVQFVPVVYAVPVVQQVFPVVVPVVPVVQLVPANQSVWIPYRY
jgi:hypothetical protein